MIHIQRDLRGTAVYAEAKEIYERARRPGAGKISDALEVSVSASGKRAVFSGAIMSALEGVATTRICEIELASGETRVLTCGPNTDRLPKYAPDERSIAFLSDRNEIGSFQLYLLSLESSEVSATPRVEGWIEYFHWSPDGERILLAVAGHGADISGGQGAITSKQPPNEMPGWMPAVAAGDEAFRWRDIWVYELSTDRLWRVPSNRRNAWEVVWCGNETVAAVVSNGPDEGEWYHARLHLIDVNTGEGREIYTPQCCQIGWPASTTAGNLLAFVEAVCSDRWIVAGDLLVIDLASGTMRHIDTGGIDITYTEWRSSHRLLLAGHRGFETVVGMYDAMKDEFAVLWSSREISAVGRYVTLSGFGEAGDCVLVGEGYLRAPEIAVIHSGRYRVVKSFDLGYVADAAAIRALECMSWRAADGLEVQGWLLLPEGEPPHPLVVHVHGGPVWHWRPTWLGRRSAAILLLLRRGYGVFLPNPRGSSGRGRLFAEYVRGDVGGADAHDILAGIDELVKRGIADSTRLGVTGASYGGFMTSWLITQDRRFAAAVPIAPTTNQVTQYLLSNIPDFVDLFVGDGYTNPNGRFYARSPVLHAHKVKTPTLSICGALDRCTPAEEAMQFHSALRRHGIESVLVTYPQEGHGVRTFPASIDFAARVVDWFQRYIQPKNATEA